MVANTETSSGRRAWGIALCVALIAACASAGPNSGPDFETVDAPKHDKDASDPDEGLPDPDTGPDEDDSGNLDGATVDVTTDTTEAGPAMTCGGLDSECSGKPYMAGCTDGTCYSSSCCCSTSRKCRVGSFPICCPAGEVCKDTGTGTCGPP